MWPRARPGPCPTMPQREPSPRAARREAPDGLFLRNLPVPVPARLPGALLPDARALEIGHAAHGLLRLLRVVAGGFPRAADRHDDLDLGHGADDPPLGPAEALDGDRRGRMPRRAGHVQVLQLLRRQFRRALWDDAG